MSGALVKLIAPLLMTVVLTSEALAASHDATFVLVRLSNVEDITVRTSEVTIDGTFRLTFSPERHLAGKSNALPITRTVTSSRPVQGNQYYLLLDREGGRQKVVWSGLARSGVCVEQEVADEYGLGAAIRRLRKSHPCR